MVATYTPSATGKTLVKSSYFKTRALQTGNAGRSTTSCTHYRTNKMHTFYIKDLINYSLLIFFILLLIFYELNILYLDNSYSLYFNFSMTEIP